MSAARDAHGRFVKGSGVVRDVDHGYDALLKRVFEFGHPVVVIGVLEGEGGKTHKAPAAMVGAEPVTLLDVATWMEFGFVMVNGTQVPARSFIRAWFDQASPQLRRDFVKLMQAVVKGTRTKDQILELLGLLGVGGVQKFIADNQVRPPTTDATNERKGSSVTLIESGQLRSAITYAVREAK